MTITLNGCPAEIHDGVTLTDLLARFGMPDRGIAIALNGLVVQRSAWSRTLVPDQGRVEIVTAMQGG